ncbi:MAG TPA: hypothetical protein PLB25_02305 [Rhodoferax sp.]|nr:hypothetical protein [Rhodoferax sp.]
MAQNQNRPIQPELPCAMLSTPAIIICKLLDCLIFSDAFMPLAFDGYALAAIYYVAFVTLTGSTEQINLFAGLLMLSQPVLPAALEKCDRTVATGCRFTESGNEARRQQICRKVARGTSGC